MDEKNEQEQNVVSSETAHAENPAEPTERLEPQEDRIAPSSARVDGEEAGGSASENGGFSEASPRRSRMGKIVAGVAACAVVACAAFAGVGYAAGWFGDSADQPETPSAAQKQQAPADGDGKKAEAAASKGQDAGSEDAEGAGAAADSEAAASGERVAAAGEAAAASADEAPAASRGSSSADAAAAPAPEASPAPAPAPTPEPAPAPEPVAPSTVTVSVYVDSSRAAAEGWPSCMASTSVTLNQGASVYDALCASGVSVNGSSSYISAINGLAEKACGPGSGWLYFVNGSSPGYGCGSYILQGGESVTFAYTRNMGNDL